MKSYSDDIPNVTKEQQDRTAKETAETNEIAKASLAMMKEFEHELEITKNNVFTKLKVITMLVAITLLTSIGGMLLTAYLSSIT